MALLDVTIYEGSSNGKTRGFGPRYQGSNPCPSAIANVANSKEYSMVKKCKCSHDENSHAAGFWFCYDCECDDLEEEKCTI